MSKSRKEIKSIKQELHELRRLHTQLKEESSRVLNAIKNVGTSIDLIAQELARRG